MSLSEAIAIGVLCVCTGVKFASIEEKKNIKINCFNATITVAIQCAPHNSEASC